MWMVQFRGVPPSYRRHRPSGGGARIDANKHASTRSSSTGRARVRMSSTRRLKGAGGSPRSGCSAGTGRKWRPESCNELPAAISSGYKTARGATTRGSTTRLEAGAIGRRRPWEGAAAPVPCRGWCRLRSAAKQYAPVGFGSSTPPGAGRAGEVLAAGKAAPQATTEEVQASAAELGETRLKAARAGPRSLIMYVRPPEREQSPSSTGRTG